MKEKYNIGVLLVYSLFKDLKLTNSKMWGGWIIQFFSSGVLSSRFGVRRASSLVTLTCPKLLLGFCTWCLFSTWNMDKYNPVFKNDNILIAFFPQASQTLADILQRKVAKYGDDSGGSYSTHYLPQVSLYLFQVRGLVRPSQVLSQSITSTSIKLGRFSVTKMLTFSSLYVNFQVKDIYMLIVFDIVNVSCGDFISRQSELFI